MWWVGVVCDERVWWVGVVCDEGMWWVGVVCVLKCLVVASAQSLV